MNHYTIRTASGECIEYDAETVSSFMGSGYALGDCWRIPQGKGFLYVRRDMVETVREEPIPLPHDEWSKVYLDYLYSNGLSERSFNALKRAGLSTVQDILSWTERYGKLRNIRNIGSLSENEIAKLLLDMYGLDVYTGRVGK